MPASGGCAASTFSEKLVQHRTTTDKDSYAKQLDAPCRGEPPVCSRCADEAKPRFASPTIRLSSIPGRADGA